VAEVICQEFVEVSSLVHQPSQHFETLNDYCHDDQSNILNPKELIIEGPVSESKSFFHDDNYHTSDNKISNDNNDNNDNNDYVTNDQQNLSIGLESNACQDMCSIITESDQLQSQGAEEGSKESVYLSSGARQPSQHFETLTGSCPDDHDLTRFDKSIERKDFFYVENIDHDIQDSLRDFVQDFKVERSSRWGKVKKKYIKNSSPIKIKKKNNTNTNTTNNNFLDVYQSVKKQFK
jgi:hypothetical protein